MTTDAEYDPEHVREVMDENMRLKSKVKSLEEKLNYIQSLLKNIGEFANGTLLTDNLQRFYFWPERRKQAND